MQRKLEEQSLAGRLRCLADYETEPCEAAPHAAYVASPFVRLGEDVAVAPGARLRPDHCGYRSPLRIWSLPLTAALTCDELRMTIVVNWGSERGEVNCGRTERQYA